MINTTPIMLQTVITTLCIIGILSCVHCVFDVFKNFICSKFKSNREKGNLTKAACLVVNIDKIGDRIEYYIRTIQDDIKNQRCMYISKIILYSHSKHEEESQTEISRMCELLTSDYNNIIFVKGDFADFTNFADNL